MGVVVVKPEALLAELVTAMGFTPSPSLVGRIREVLEAHRCDRRPRLGFTRDAAEELGYSVQQIHNWVARDGIIPPEYVLLHKTAGVIFDMDGLVRWAKRTGRYRGEQ